MSTSATGVDGSVGQTAPTEPGPAQAFGLVLDAAVGTVAQKLERKVTGWLDKLDVVSGRGGPSDAVMGLTDKGLDAVAESGGVLQAAGAEGVKARVHGRSPAWAAVRAVWRAGGPAVRAAIVTAAVGAVVLLLASPALLVVYLLSWLVIAAVYRSRASRHGARAAA
jgi:hypothetical protein